MRGFSAFPVLTFPGARALVARRGVFPGLQKSLLSTTVLAPAGIVPPTSGLTEILALGLANQGGGAATASIDLLLLSGMASSQVVGRARLITDQLLQDAATMSAMGTNKPVAFRLFLWPSVDDRLNVLGLTHGGVGPVTCTAGGSGLATPPNVVIPAPAINEAIVTTTDVVSGPFDLAFLANVAASAAFTLDALYVLEWPDITDVPY